MNFFISLWKIIAIFIFALGICASISITHAQNASITVSCTKCEEKIEPGSTFTSSIRVTNNGESQTFYLFTRNIKGITDDGTPLFAEEGEPTGYELSSWVRTSVPSIDLETGETKEIQFSVLVPQNASPGGHFGALFLSRTAERPRDSSGVGVGFQVGSILNFRIAGDIEEDARLRDFFTDKTLYSRPDVRFTARVENLGNVIIRPRGTLQITNFFGKQVANLFVNEQAGAVFPKGVREFTTRWNDPGLGFGRYQAVMGLVYGDEGRKTISSTATFWILPLHIILPIAGGILALIGILYYLIRLHVQKRVRELIQNQGADQKINTAILPELKPPLSRLAAITIALLSFTVIFLLILFFVFA